MHILSNYSLSKAGTRADSNSLLHNHDELPLSFVSRPQLQQFGVPQGVHDVDLLSNLEGENKYELRRENKNENNKARWSTRWGT